MYFLKNLCGRSLRSRPPLFEPPGSSNYGLCSTLFFFRIGETTGFVQDTSFSWHFSYRKTMEPTGDGEYHLSKKQQALNRIVALHLGPKSQKTLKKCQNIQKHKFI